MIQQIESNDEGFTGIWSRAIKLECGIIFLNPKLEDDPFFNKLSSVTCISEKMIDESIVQFKKNHSMPYVYSLNYPEFENMLKRKGFVYHDTQHVLKNRRLPSKIPTVTKITPDKISLWTGIFCKAYDCPKWTDTVNTILKNSISSVEYFVDESKSSCMALYEKNSILGLYCLGTIPDRRRHGYAASLVDFALHEANSRNLGFLILESYARDNLTKFYSQLGFEQVYNKIIYTI
jgi:hypothetical protein